jgi:putative DNA primase/helicase
MADFAIWVSAAEQALGWKEGSFLAAYERNRSESNKLALEASPLVNPLRRFAERGVWSGTATQLLQELKDEGVSGPVGEQEIKINHPRVLSEKLGRLVPNLHRIGITVKFDQTPGSYSDKLIIIGKNDDVATRQISRQD